MRARRPTRVVGFPYVGIYRYSLRFGTDGRARHFSRREVVELASTQILRTCDEERFALLAYCYMPDHVHLAVEGEREDADLRRLVKVAKQRAAYQCRSVGIRSLWHEGYYERVLRDEEATERLVRYILDNPVRARLVEKAEDYPFSGAKYWPSHW